MRRACLLPLIALLAACQGGGAHASADLGGGLDGTAALDDLAPSDECPSVDAVRCRDGGARQICALVGGALRWSPPIDCATDEACVDGICGPPSAVQLAQAAALDEMIDQLSAQTSYPYSYDKAAILAAGHLAIIHGDGSEGAYLQAMWEAFLSIPEGHQSMLLKSGCGTKLPSAYESRLGVCGRQHPDGLIITVAKQGNLLGLQKGDKIVAAGDESGAALLLAAHHRARCASTFPSVAGQREDGAAGFFATVPSGLALTVEATDGTQRQVVVPTARDKTALWCSEVFGRSTQTVAEATTLPDGTAVIRVPSWVPFDESFPTDPSLYDDYRMRFQARIKTVFDTVKDAPRLVWDVRGNQGGMTLVALAIASGMPGAQSTVATHCTARLAATDPPMFDTTAYAQYALTPGGDFLYSGKVAVLIDGLGYSATDYFAHFVREATTSIVVGAPTAGGYGGSSGSFDITSTPPALTFYYDVNRCVRDDTSAPLEGHGVEPTLAVSYDPADLAGERDTVLAAAIAALQ